ncbi:MAG: hypothetical protein WKF97_16625 [Chitinophagaceae bacterium]
MKLIVTVYLCITLLLSFHRSSAQSEIIRQQSCENQSFKPQIDSLKRLLTSQGFDLVREASMAMESEYEMPVIFPLNQGAWYNFVFIGDPTSKVYEVRMYDENERQVFYKKNMWGDVDGNIISYTYVPQFSEYHMLKPVQVNKKKKQGLCGYVMMFKRVK